MLAFVPIALTVLLSFQVFPAALGISVKKPQVKAIFPILILVLTQAVMFLVGYYLGQKFMYLLRGFSTVVLSAGFFIIGIRMIMEVLKIRKGERTYELKNERSVFFIAVAQSINTFVTGLLFFFVPVNPVMITATLLIASSVLAVAGAFAGITKTNLVFASLLYLFAGAFIIISSVYFIFAPLV